jgi:hypothetical protein
MARSSRLRRHRDIWAIRILSKIHSVASSEPLEIAFKGMSLIALSPLMGVLGRRIFPTMFEAHSLTWGWPPASIGDNRHAADG